MSNEIDPALLGDLEDAERSALAAHTRWKARRATKVRAWACYVLGVLTGAGIASLLIAGMRYLP